MPLPTEAQKPRMGYEGKLFIVYGRPKVGKSTFCSKIPGAVFLDTEHGLSHLEVFRISVNKWEDLQNAWIELKEGKHNFRNVVIDTLDSAYRLCSEYVCTKEGIESALGADDHGKTWFKINDAMRRAVLRFRELPYGIWLTSHMAERDVKERTGGVTRSMVDLPPKALKMIYELADFLMYADIEEVTKDGKGQEQRVLRLKSSRYFDGGGRLAPGMKVPEKIPLEFSEFERVFGDNGGPKTAKEAKERVMEILKGGDDGRK